MKNKAMAVLGVALVAGSAYMISKTFSQSREHPAAPRELSIKEKMMEGKPFNGGKPHPPVEISSNISGEITADQNVNLTVQLTPTKECSGMKTHVRGLDGVVVEGDTDVTHSQCVPGQANEHTVTARVPVGVAGYVVVDYEFAADGKVYQASKAIPINARGARHAAKPDGEVSQDENGNPIVIMKAQETKGKNVSK